LHPRRHTHQRSTNQIPDQQTAALLGLNQLAKQRRPDAAA
jgi:hypothetical protein